MLISVLCCWVLLHLKQPWLEPFAIFTDENTQKQVDDLGAQFTDHFIQDPEHLTLLLTLLEVLDLFYSQKYVCCNMSVNGGLMLLFFLGVWLPCAVAWGKAVDCSAEEPGATGPRCHPGQPHGWDSPCMFTSTLILRTAGKQSHQSSNGSMIESDKLWMKESWYDLHLEYVSV